MTEPMRALEVWWTGIVDSPTEAFATFVDAIDGA